MKKWVVFLLGVLTGIVLLSCVASLYNSMNQSNTTTEDGKEQSDGIKMFKEPGDIINEQSFEVFQVLAEDAALVRGKGDSYSIYNGLVYLLINRDGKYYYDGEKIDIKKNQKVRQVGIYRYENKSEIIKTVPIIEIVDK